MTTIITRIIIMSSYQYYLINIIMTIIKYNYRYDIILLDDNT